MAIKQTLDKGRVPVKIWTNDIDPKAMAQLENVASMPFVHHHVAAMPDVLRALRREALQGPAGPLTVCVEASVEAILDAMENEGGESPLDLIGRTVILRSEPDFAVDEFDIFVE